MKILYFDCFSGISGDMTIGALLDAGGDFGYLEQELNKLNISDEYELTINKVIKNGISSTKFDVMLTNNHNDHSHDHHEHHDHSHSHDHRSYKDIVTIIGEADLSEKAKQMAGHIFKKIGEAEAKIHGVALEDVHFHEVGAVDSIVDIVATAILIDHLKIDKVKASPIPVGSGNIHIDHGIYPVPAPATLEILRGIPVAQSKLRGELTTPTGAAIVAILVDEFCTLPDMTIQEVGYGAGTKDFKDHPNVLRVIIGKQ